MPDILQVKNLSANIGGRPVLRDVSFSVGGGEAVGLAGESGCGKSILALALMGLLPPEAEVVGGEALLGGKNLFAMPPEERRQTRGGQMALIFQEPMTSLNPVLKIGAQVAEAILCREKISRKAARARVLELLQTVRIPDAAARLNAYPHELSGGMRQRVMIATALACSPSLLIADEPTTALDVTVQGQILALLAELRREFNMAVLLITHDFGVLAQVAGRVLTMYRGAIIEAAAAVEIFAAPRHPYTAGLLSCAPSAAANCDVAELPAIAGRLPGLAEEISGCAFHPRCPRVADKCRASFPPLENNVRCFYPLEGAV